VWCGIEPLGDRDGRLALYLTDHLPRLRRPAVAADLSPREQAIVAHLSSEGASFFAGLYDAAGAGFPGETVDALWDLVWKGIITNDTFHSLRAFTRLPEARQRKPSGRRSFRSRRVAPPAAERTMVGHRGPHRRSRLADRVVHPRPRSSCSRATAC
jgi:ATP-dependent Lhr-like helicase